MEIVSKIITPSSSESCEDCEVFSVDNAIENYALKEKFQLRALQCLVNLCPNLLEGETFGEEVLESHDQEYRESIIEKSDAVKRYRRYSAAKERVKKDSFKKTKQRILEKLNSPELSKEFLYQLNFVVESSATREAAWHPFLEEKEKQILKKKKEFEKNPSLGKLEENEFYLSLVKNAERLKTLIASGNLYDSDFYANLVEQKKAAKVQYMGRINFPKEEEQNEFNRRFVPNLQLDEKGRAIPISELVNRFIRYHKESSNEVLVGIIDKELTQQINASDEEKLLKAKEHLIESGRIISSDYIQELLMTLSVIDMSRKLPFENAISNVESIRKDLISFFDSLEAEWGDDEATGVDCYFQDRMRQLKTTPTAKQIKEFHEKVFPEELEKILKFAKENYSNDSYQALVHFFNENVKITYPRDLQSELESLNSFFNSNLQDPEVDIFMEKSRRFDPSEFEGFPGSCRSEWQPELMIEDRIDTRPINLVKVSAASIMSVERGREILRHELAHAIYRFFEKRKKKLSSESRRKMRKHKNCTTKNHNYWFYHSKEQFKSEDYADMVSALTSDDKPGNAFCNMAGSDIHAKSALGIFRNRHDSHSPSLYRAVIYEILKGKEAPQSCLDLYEEVFGDEIEKHSCYPDKVQ